MQFLQELNFDQKITSVSESRPVPFEGSESSSSDDGVEDLLAKFYGTDKGKKVVKKEKDFSLRTYLSVVVQDKNIMTFKDQVYSFVNKISGDNLSVVINNSDGKVDNSTGSFVASTIIKIDIASDILQDNPISSRNVGSGMSRVARIATRPAAKMILLLSASFAVSDFVLFADLLCVISMSA